MANDTRAPQPEIMQPEHYGDPEEEGRLVANPDIQALTQLNTAEISQQIMTARAYPRSTVGFRRSMREMVTYDQPTALSCLYALKRGNKIIEGPSIRFAEAALQAWGNSRAGSRIVDIGAEFITAQGFFYDLERNMALAFEVMRRITDKDGQRFGDDMIGVTGNAASSIAFRNAVLKGIPKIAWNEPYQAARQLSIGKGESITVKREEMLKAFAPLGVDKEQIFGLLGVKGIDDVTVDQMIVMGGVLNSIKEGEATVEVVFAPENMTNIGQVSPPRPKRSEFERKEPPKKADAPAPQQQPKTEAKPEAAKAEQPKPQADPPAAETKAKAEPDPQPEPDQAEEPAAEQQKVATDQPSADQELEDFFNDMVKELAGINRIKEVTDFRERVGDQLEGDMLKKWLTACDDRQRAILEGTRKARK